MNGIEKIIRIRTSQGLVIDVEGIPEGFTYEVIECDKYGEPIEQETNI